MILMLQKNTPEPAIRQLLAQLSLQNVKGGCVAGDNAILLPLVGETWRLDPSALQALPFVQEARRLTPAYRLAGRAAHPENTVVAVGDVSIGADFCLIAGPCAVESAYQMDTLSRAVKDAGAQLLRGGVFKSRLAHQQKSLKPQWFQGFFFCLEAILALQLALFLRQTLDEPLHTVSTAASHLFCHMTIDIQRKRCCVMTKVFLHCLDVIAAL